MSKGKSKSKSESKPQPGGKHFREVESIAAAWNIKLYEQRPRRLKQLAALRSITAHAEFPAKVKGKGWPADAVRQFGLEWIKVDGKGREFKVEKTKSPAQPSPPLNSPPTAATINQPPLPAQAAPADGELFAPDKSAFENSLDLWQQKLEDPLTWAQAPIQKWQLELLRQHRPHLFAKDPGNAPPHPDGVESENISGGVRGVAAWIRNRYPWVVVDHVKIQRWQRGEYLPAGCREHFPAAEAGGSGRFKTAEVVAWVERYWPQPASGQELPLNIVALRDQAEAEQIEHERWIRQKERGQYVRADAVESYIGSLAARDTLLTDKLIEDRNGLRGKVREALLPLLSEEQVEQVDALLTARFAAANQELKETYATSRNSVLAELKQLQEAEKPKL